MWDRAGAVLLGIGRTRPHPEVCTLLLQTKLVAKLDPPLQPSEIDYLSTTHDHNSPSMHIIV